MRLSIPLPPKIAHYVGPLIKSELPPQGMAFQVYILTSQRGRFVLKLAHTAAMSEALNKEASILRALHAYKPFVAQPLIEEALEDGHAFLFLYLPGEPLHSVLQQAEPAERAWLIRQFAQMLQRIHSWRPDLPYPHDWLATKLAWLHTKILARPRETLIANTNSSFDGQNAHHLLAELQAAKSTIENEIVFGHYDYCLPNVLMHAQHVAGVIDWSGGGYIDRRFDLATALFSLGLFEPLLPPDYQNIF
ncbi:hypothetical protein EPA93_09490 [Ktedonosporobacter rubrisoli]|uniref:Aminoglycoside phosphotransferase domain-containing protein n=1 Tax=Ktedonosporobacter rubrisoli TaxID=2509675 RepID=A0A4V0YYH4_KTERU|nr:phosphotransferase [Ktedonosporobacter rubrisoli]QBD76231.1 hypothetical protein EPA93_09490 [Ktedonosporobacter rubrisoli]